MSDPMAQSGEVQASAQDRARWDLATKLVFGSLLFLLSAAITWATYSARDVGHQVQRASEQLVQVAEAQKSLIQLVSSLKDAVAKLEGIVDEVRLEQAARANFTQRLDKLEQQDERARDRVRDLERRVGALEGRPR